ncbi:outer membrane lipoprotein carrier protein LolA [Kitasatospora sp. NPDC059327]|uniref:LolA family protein n=1 Tax=Kitasatospora sp. NPDC059327 TaxID=3346803 RepID=UPI0036BFFACF
MTDDTTTERQQGGGVPYRSGRRTAVRVAVPVTVAAVIAAGVGLVPALADDSAPDLPTLTAEQVVAKALGSQAQTLSGTVSVSADLGVPSQLLAAAGGGIGGGARSAPGAGSGAPGEGSSGSGSSGSGSGASAGGSGSGGSSAATPEAKLAALLDGEHTLRVSVDGPDRQRVGLIENLAGYELVHNGDQFWAWDSATNEALHLTGPQGARPGGHPGKAPLTGVPTTPQEAARQFLAAGAGTTAVTVDGTATVAGQKAYRLSVKPTQSGSTIGEVRIAVAADNGVPLAVVVKGSDGGTVLDVHFTEVSFAKPAAKTFEFVAPKGAKVTEGKADGTAPALSEEAAKDAAGAAGRKGAPGAVDGLNVIGEGWTAVLTAKLPTGDITVPTKGKQGRHGEGGPAGPQDPAALAKTLGKPVAGGSLISTKVLNVLVTDDGRVFAGAVTLPVLQSAAGVK